MHYTVDLIITSFLLMTIVPISSAQPITTPLGTTLTTTVLPTKKDFQIPIFDPFKK